MFIFQRQDLFLFTCAPRLIRYLLIKVHRLKLHLKEVDFVIYGSFFTALFFSMRKQKTLFSYAEYINRNIFAGVFKNKYVLLLIHISPSKNIFHLRLYIPFSIQNEMQCAEIRKLKKRFFFHRPH